MDRKSEVLVQMPGTPTYRHLDSGIDENDERIWALWLMKNSPQ